MKKKIIRIGKKAFGIPTIVKTKFILQMANFMANIVKIDSAPYAAA